MAAGGRGGRQPALPGCTGPRGAAPATRCLIGCPRLWDAAAQSYWAVRLGCAARSRRRLTGGLQELAAVVPHRVSVAAGVPARGPACPRRGLHETLGLSGGGERVVAELGQDVAGLPDDLAGLGQGGALAVLAVLDGGVIAVVGSRSAAVGLAGLIHRPAQHRRALPGQPARRALPVRGPYGDVQPGEPDRLAGRGEPARPAQPAGQRQRGHWPGPIQPRRQHPGAG